MNYLAENIKFLRQKQGDTQKQFGERFGWSRFNVSSYEDGRASVPIERLLQLKEAYGYSVEEMFSFKLPIEKEELPLFSASLNTEPVYSKNSDGIIEVPAVKNLLEYASKHHEARYIASLPVFQLPLVQHADYRAFLIDKKWQIGIHARQWVNVKDGSKTLVFLRNGTWLYGKVLNELMEHSRLIISTDSKPNIVAMSEIEEVWEQYATFSFGIEDANSGKVLKGFLERLQKEISQLSQGL